MATAPKLPKSDPTDPEGGIGKVFDPTKSSRSSTPKTASLDVPPPKVSPTDYFMKTLATGQNLFGTKIAGKKASRKQKKRAHKKTQKRRGRK